MTDRLTGDETELAAEAFIAGAAALRHIGSDPLLPSALLPEDWPGSALRVSYRRYQQSFNAVAREWFRSP